MQENLQEIQMLEYNLQNILLQKQAFQMELDESISALQELENSGEEVYKIIGQLMLKTSKDKIYENLENKKKVIESRLSMLDKQEESMRAEVEKKREEELGFKKQQLKITKSL